MKVYSVFDEEFKAYGTVHTGYNTAALLDAMKKIPMPAAGVNYEPGIPSLEACEIKELLGSCAYGGMPIQIGMCWGYNTKLNCLEYHRDSEINIGLGEFILLLAKQDEITDGTLDTSVVKAFRAPAGAVVEVYATTLHYAPCHCDAQEGFRVAIVLPAGTNLEKPNCAFVNNEGAHLAARNKWLLAHPEASEAANPLFIGLKGKNIDISID